MDRFVNLRPSNLITRLLLTCAASVITTGTATFAHFPDYENQPVHRRIELIPSFGYHIPSYRERYNRPRYIGGKIAYHIAPTSQEAMSWHRSVHQGYYANHAPRMENRYFYPKPWQVLTVGPRVPVGEATVQTPDTDEPNQYDSSEVDREDNGTLKPEAAIEILPRPDL